jgi:hypothetical protein
MTIKMACDHKDCDSWTRVPSDTMISVSQLCADEDHHFCSMEHLLAWAQSVVQPAPF